jgi:hypothetical protein
MGADPANQDHKYNNDQQNLLRECLHKAGECCPLYQKANTRHKAVIAIGARMIRPWIK